MENGCFLVKYSYLQGSNKKEVKIQSTAGMSLEHDGESPLSEWTEEKCCFPSMWALVYFCMIEPVHPQPPPWPRQNLIMCRLRGWKPDMAHGRRTKNAPIKSLLPFSFCLKLHILVSPTNVQLNIDCQVVVEKPIKAAGNMSSDGYQVLGKMSKSIGSKGESATVSELCVHTNRRLTLSTDTNDFISILLWLQIVHTFQNKLNWHRFHLFLYIIQVINKSLLIFSIFWSYF